jgi:hypothetical protein
VIANRKRGKFQLEIPNWHPARLNQWDGCHWSRRAKLKKIDRQVVGCYAMLSGVPHAKGKRRVSLQVVLGPRQRGADVDAFWKSLLDALTACRLLKDDSRRWCELGSVEFERGPQMTSTIILEDVRS